MAQVLVTREDAWYQGIASLKNIREKELELSILKYASAVFNNYYCFQSAFVFKNAAGETSGPDILLISRNFKQWLIVEVELAGKDLGHTRKQLRVFTNPLFGVGDLVKHCCEKTDDLVGKEAELNNLFANAAPEVLVIFDTHNSPVLSILQAEFTIKICVFEIYKTQSHDLELYRLSGDYPYVYSGGTFLKAWDGDFEIFKVERPEFFDDLGANTNFIAEHRLQTMNIILYRSKKDEPFIKIPGNPFPPGKNLKIYRTEDNKFVIEKV